MKQVQENEDGVVIETESFLFFMPVLVIMSHSLGLRLLWIHSDDRLTGQACDRDQPTDGRYR